MFPLLKGDIPRFFFAFGPVDYPNMHEKTFTYPKEKIETNHLERYVLSQQPQ